MNGEPPCSCLEPRSIRGPITPAYHGIDLELVQQILLVDLGGNQSGARVTGFEYLQGSVGWGLTSLRYVLSVTFISEGKTNNRTYFVKVPVTTAYSVKPETHHEMKRFLEKDLDVFFDREATFYSELTERCRQRAQMLKSRPQFPFPRFFYARRGTNSGNSREPSSQCHRNHSCHLLILEYLEHYRQDTSEDKSLDHLKLICSALGSLHAMGTAVVRLYPELAQLMQENLSVLMASLDDDLAKRETSLIRAHLYNTNRKNMAFKLLSLCNGGRFKKEFLKSFSIEKNECLLHLDIWNGNFMFLYDSDGCNPLDVRLIDFQLASFGSVGFELATLQLMWRSFTENRTRLLEIYQEKFQSQLMRLGIVRGKNGSDLVPIENTLNIQNSSSLFNQSFLSTAKRTHFDLCSDGKVLLNRPNYVQMQNEQRSSSIPKGVELQGFQNQYMQQRDSLMILGKRSADFLVDQMNRDYFCMLIFWLYKGSPLVNLVFEEVRDQAKYTAKIGSSPEPRAELLKNDTKICLRELSRLFPELYSIKLDKPCNHLSYSPDKLHVQLKEVGKVLNNFEIPTQSLVRLVLGQVLGPKSAELIENIISDLSDRL